MPFSDSIKRIYIDACIAFRDAPDEVERQRYSALCAAFEAIYPVETGLIRNSGLR